MVKDSIKLVPPLPWVSPSGNGGFVHEISGDCLVLNAIKETSQDQMTISITTDSHHMLNMVGSLNVVGSNAIFHCHHGQEKALATLVGKVRKSQHVDICVNKDVEASDRFTGFSDFSFVPESLPELDEDDIDTSRNFLDRSFSAPLFISGMTAGTEKASLINHRLAFAASKFNIPMGIGSQRLAQENLVPRSVFAVKKTFPNIFLVGNLGFAQLKRPDFLDICHDAVEMIEADALAIHLNTVQECLQIEGDRQFKGVLERIRATCQSIQVPIVIKEVGSGMSPDSSRKLIDAGVSVIDIAGKGGTSWGYIEGLRSSRRQSLALAQSFRDWGIPTAYSLAAIRKDFPQFPLIASGGIRDGLTVAKAIALGGTMAGMALPLLRAAMEGKEELVETVDTIIRGLKTAMLACGCQRLENLSKCIEIGKPLQNKAHQFWQENYR